jgi:ABC-2 type transport system ATP-binding protein
VSARSARLPQRASTRLRGYDTWMRLSLAAAAEGPYRSLRAEQPRSTEAPIIECEGLVHFFGPKPVLRGVTFEVPRGSVYGFVGPNGAGKTTTLRILATLLEPTSGTARIAGHDVTAHPERVRRVLGYMPDGHGIHERVTVAEYLHFYASAHGIHGEDRSRAVERVLELTAIGPLRAIHVTTLSKGQKQRIVLARTLLHDPEVLVLDEPASDLDPRARIELRTLLGELARMGKTVLLSSHILTELDELCDSIGILEGGRVVVSGPIVEIQAKARPGRRLRLTVLNRPADAVALLRAQPQVSSTALVDGENAGPSTLEVTYGGDEWAIAELVNLLSSAQIAICAVEPERTDLERIFMDVTNQEPREASGAAVLAQKDRGVRGV